MVALTKAQKLEILRRKKLAAELQAYTAEWFDEQAAFYNDTAKQIAAICGRRAGKTKGGCGHFVRKARATPGTRLLYLNETRQEARKLAWIGNFNDGMYSLVHRAGLTEDQGGPVKVNQTELWLHFTDNDSWIYLRGAKDDKEIGKNLGGAFDEIWWDESQKIPPRLRDTIEQNLFATLLDNHGTFRLTGSPSRQMVGLFFDVTHPDISQRKKGWAVHHWNLLSNPHFGRGKLINGQWYVYWGHPGKEQKFSGPHSPEDLPAAIGLARHVNGILQLQQYYEGVALDSPIMVREGYGRWSAEDSNYVYEVHKCRGETLFYAPARVGIESDLNASHVLEALADLPGDWRDYVLTLGADLGYQDPFAVCLWAYHPRDPNIYEVLSWKRTHLSSDEQSDYLKRIRNVVTVGQIVADAAGIGKQVVAGWSKEWIDRYNLPITEAKKSEKNTYIKLYNNDLVHGRMKLRKNGLLYDELQKIQWSSILNARGQPFEDSSIPNDTADASLYAHRHSYQYRYHPTDITLSPEERLKREEKAQLEAIDAIQQPDPDGYPSIEHDWFRRIGGFPGNTGGR